MRKSIEGCFEADGVSREYQAWFEPDSEGREQCAIRHRYKASGSAAAYPWSPTTHISLPERHAWSLGRLAFTHFRGVLGLDVREEAFGEDPV